MSVSWRDFASSSTALVGDDVLLTVHAPGDFCDTWTAQAERVGPNGEQLDFSGLIGGGADRDAAKAAAIATLTRMCA